MNMSTYFSKTNWTLIVTFIVVAGNAIVPLLPVGIETTVASILIALSTIFHVQDKNKAVAAAVAKAQAPQA